MRLRKLTVGVAAALILAVAGAAYASMATNYYQGSGSGTCVNVVTGLDNINALDVYEIPKHGRGVHAYTSDAIQSLSQGAFVNEEGKLETGIELNGDGTFSVCNAAFTEKGHSYAWEARAIN